MEAVPRLPMIALDTLKTTSGSVDYATKIKQYITSHYQEDGNKYSDECRQLETLRNHACTVMVDFNSCSVLRKYYGQLHLLQTRIPMTEGEEAAITFTWNDIYIGKKKSMTDIRYEEASILHNLGCLHSLLGSVNSRTSEENMKVSCTHFQCAAGVFTYLKDTFPLSEMTLDLCQDMMCFYIQLMLGQAQECLLEKSMTDNRKSSLVARIAGQVVVYYRQALSLLENTVVLEILSGKKCRDWAKLLSIKVSYFNSLSYLFMGIHSDELKKYGERVTYYQLALDHLTDAVRYGKGVDTVQDTITFTMDIVSGKCTNAKKENDFIYHEPVPAADVLCNIKGASLVKALPFQPYDKSVAGEPIFKRLVPLEAHQASSLYSEEKAKLMRKVIGDIEEHNTNLRQNLDSLVVDEIKFPAEIVEEVPQALIERCAALSIRPTAVSDLVDSMKALSTLYCEVDSNVDEINEILDTDTKEAEEGGVEPSSAERDQLIEIVTELSDIKSALQEGSTLNTELHRAMGAHVSSLKLLAGPLEDITASLPSLKSLAAETDEDIVRNLRHIMSKLDEMTKQRNTLEQQLRDTFNQDDITQKVIGAQSTISTKELFAEELNKYDTLVTYINQNLSAQDNILTALIEANANYVPMRKAMADMEAKREARIMELISSYDCYNDLLLKSREALDFFKKLKDKMTVLLETAHTWYTTQKQLRDRIKPATQAAPARPTAPKPALNNAHSSPSRGPPLPTPPTPATAADIGMMDEAAIQAILEGADLDVMDESALQAIIQALAANTAPASHRLPRQQPPAVSYPGYMNPAPRQVRYMSPHSSPTHNIYPPPPRTQGPGVIEQPPGNLTYPGVHYSGVPQPAIPPVSGHGYTQQGPINTPPVHTTPTLPGPVGQWTQQQHVVPQQQHPMVSQQQQQQPIVSQQQPIVRQQLPVASQQPVVSYQSFVPQQLPIFSQQSFVPQQQFLVSQTPPVVPQQSFVPQQRPMFSQQHFIPQQTQQGIIQQQQQQHMLPHQRGPQPGVTPPTHPSLPYQQQYSINQQHTIPRQSYQTSPHMSPQHSRHVPQTHLYNQQQHPGPPQQHPGPPQQHPGPPQQQQYLYQQQHQPQTSQQQIVYPQHHTASQPVTWLSQSHPHQPGGYPPQQHPNTQRPAYSYPQGPGVQGPPPQQQQLILDPPSSLPAPLTPVSFKIDAQQRETSSTNNNTENNTCKTTTTPTTTTQQTTTTTKCDNKSVSRVESESVVRNKSAQMSGKPSSEPYNHPASLEQFITEAERFDKIIDSLSKPTLSGPTALDREWKDLQDSQDRDSRQFSISIARCYPLKNTLPDIMPYDHTRVVLTSTEPDYINASYITSLTQTSPVFIACQTPLPTDVPGFWGMVFDQQISVVVMLLGVEEGGRYDPYWPTAKGQVITYGRLMVCVQSTAVSQHWLMRMINMTDVKTRQMRSVVHLQFTSWPLSGAVTDPLPLLNFIREVRHYHSLQRNLSTPVVVSCLAGVDRTAVFIIVYCAVHEIDCSNGLIDLPSTIRSLRLQRKHMIQKKEELEFCYTAIQHHTQHVLLRIGVKPPDTHIPQTSDLQKLPTNRGQDTFDIFKSGATLISIKSSVDQLGVKKTDSSPRQPEPSPRQPEPSPWQPEQEELASTEIDSINQNNEKSEMVLESFEVPVTEQYSEGQGDRGGQFDGLSLLQTHPNGAVSGHKDILDLLDPSKFTIDKDDFAKGLKKCSKASFSGEGSGQMGQPDPEDPLGMLDPLWNQSLVSPKPTTND